MADGVGTSRTTATVGEPIDWTSTDGVVDLDGSTRVTVSLLCSPRLPTGDHWLASFRKGWTEVDADKIMSRVILSVVEVETISRGASM